MSPEEVAESIVARVRAGYTLDGTAGFANPNEIRFLIRDAIRVAAADAGKERPALDVLIAKFPLKKFDE